MTDFHVTVTPEQVTAARVEQDLRRRLGLPVERRLLRLAQVELPGDIRQVIVLPQERTNSVGHHHDPDGRGLV